MSDWNANESKNRRSTWAAIQPNQHAHHQSRESPSLNIRTIGHFAKMTKANSIQDVIANHRAPKLHKSSNKVAMIGHNCTPQCWICINCWFAFEHGLKRSTLVEMHTHQVHQWINRVPKSLEGRSNKDSFLFYVRVDHLCFLFFWHCSRRGITACNRIVSRCVSSSSFCKARFLVSRADILSITWASRCLVFKR